MRITTVTPSLNYGRFLCHALASVAAQCREGLEVEHLVVDAGSSDATVALLRAHADATAATPGGAALEGLPPDLSCQPAAARHSGGGARPGYRFRWISEPDRGQTHAINKGLRQATGDILCWLNADETYRSGALAVVEEAFTRHPSWDALYGEVDFVREDGSLIRTKYDHPFSFGVLLHYGSYLPSAATFWRRRALDVAGYLDEWYRVTMDYEYWMRLAKLGIRFGFVPKSLATFAWHQANVSTRLNALQWEEALRVQRLYGPHAWSRRASSSYYRLLYEPWHLWRGVLRTLRQLRWPRNQDAPNDPRRCTP